MILITLTQDQTITIILWALGIVSSFMVTLSIHIGNQGSKIKQNVAAHGERIAHVETSVKNLEATGHRIEDKVDQLLMSRK